MFNKPKPEAMSTTPTPTQWLAEAEPDHTTEIPSPDRADAQEEAIITKQPPEPTDQHLKATTPATSDEDASGSIPTEQAAETAGKVASEDENNTVETKTEGGGGGTIGANDDAEDATAESTTSERSPKSTKKIRRRKKDEISGKKEFSEDDSQDDDIIDKENEEEENLAYTSEGQQLYKARAGKRIRQFGQYFRNLEYRMRFFEAELRRLRGDDSKPKPKDDPESLSAERVKFIPAIRRLTWAEYKPSSKSQERPEVDVPKASSLSTWEGLKIRSNPQKDREPNSGQSSSNAAGLVSKHQHYVLEVLIEDPGIVKRRRVKKSADDEVITKASSRNSKTIQKRDPVTFQSSVTMLRCPERLRICSRPLGAILHKMILLEDLRYGAAPYVVFLRPFKLLVLYETEIREALKDLEKKWQSKEITFQTEKSSKPKPGDQEDEGEKFKDLEDREIESSAPEPAADTVVETDTLEALENLRLLVEFLDNDLKSTFDLRKQIKSKEAGSIAFADLWHLYEHGQEVRTPEEKLQIFKVTRFAGGRDLLTDSLPSNSRGIPSSCFEREDCNGAFFVECYSYDFDGTHYGPVPRVFEIRRYEGFKDITSLQVFPWCFDPEHKMKRFQLGQRGEKFMALARVNKTAHKTYCGLSLDEHAEEIESPIIVDFQLAITKGDIEIPDIGFQSTLDYDPRELREIPDGCGVENCKVYENIFQDYDFDSKVSERFLANQKPHLTPVVDPEELGEDERVLLPYSVHGFVLRSRKWRTFDIDKVEDIKYSSGFDDLVLPPGHKDTVEALVNRHSRGPETIGSRTEIKSSMDLVTGKGKGLIILLHGAPGVGKTSTAECVADKTERPLFPITCGDLGESAIEVEESLERNFSLAHKWGCVLLLDEADVFLTLRNQTDLRRNAVVSVFLRTLEYYSGILFLTTNRVGALDPAFKSRIHISLYYPKLSRKASSEIWRNHIGKAKDYFEQKGEKYSIRKREIIEFSKQHFKDLKDEKSKSEPWNGRQIRNAFQTAIALAEHEAFLNGGKPELSERHFAKVAKASIEFDRYLRMTHGRSESQLAEASRLRVDDPDKAAKKMAAVAALQRPRGQAKSDDESSATDSSDQDSSDADDVSSSEETPPPKASKKTKKKPKAPSEDEAPPIKKSKKERARQESASEEEVLTTKKTKKGKAKRDSTSEEDAPSTKKTRKEKERKKKKKKEPSSDEEQDSSEGEEEKDKKKPTKETKGKEKEKEKAKSTSKSFN